MTLGDIIIEYRNKHEMSMREFSRKSGISVAYISMLERGFSGRKKPIIPSIKTISQVAKACDTDFDGIFNRLDSDYVIRTNQEISDEEYMLIEMFRHSDDDTKKMIMRLLKYAEVVNEKKGE